METTTRHNVFCRCGHARSLTGLGLRHVCGVAKCECVRHDTAKADRREAPTKVAAESIDSTLLDRVLMEGALEHLQTRIKKATALLQSGLWRSSAGAHASARIHFEAALVALGDLGAS